MVVKINNFFLWSLIIGILFFLCYCFMDIATPFLSAFILAYLLNPIVEIFHNKFKVHRDLLVCIVFITFLSALIIILSFLMPIIYNQAALLVKNIPIYKLYMQDVIESSKVIDNLSDVLGQDIRQAIKEFINSWFSVLANIFNHIWEYMITTINTIITIILIPVLLFYFLRDWNLIIMNFNSILPKYSIPSVHKIFSNINDLLSAYIGAQLNICLILSVYYAIFFTFVNIDFSLLLGLFSGFIIIIPFIGIIVSMSIALTVCFVEFGISSKLIYVFSSYVVGYMLESYFLTPKLIGSKIGLHPLWMFFSVLVCSKYLGFKGIFFAIPIAVVIKILCQAGMEVYRSSSYYK